MNFLKFWRLAALVTVFSVAAKAGAQTQANLLANGGFEEPITTNGPPFTGSWEAFSGSAVSSSANSSLMPRTGVQHLSLSIFHANNDFAGVFQDVSGILPGTSAAFRVWHMAATSPLDLGVEVRIEWRDSLSGIEISRTPNSTPRPTGQYSQFTLRAVAPAGADTARVVYDVQTFGAEPTDTGTVFVDDATFTVGSPIFGDFDDNGAVDVGDYVTLSRHLHSDVSKLTVQQAYVFGDLTQDRKIDGNDFRGFRVVYDVANGSGAFIAMLTGIPEPSTAVLFAFASLALLRYRRGKGKHCAAPHDW